MGKVLNMTFASSLTDLREVNSSFDTGVLRICYTGQNRNNSFISRQAIERSIQSLYNCPVVCNYDRETDTLGGHDMEIVRADDGGLKIVNMTQPIGLVPESSRVWFDSYEDENGVSHEYLYAEVLLWKRQEAYEKIKKDGITAHSMEITVKSGQSIDGIYHINDFEFTAFALIGVEPCYESSALEVFSKDDFSRQYTEMMRDLKETFNKVSPSAEDDKIDNQQYSMNGVGGEKALEKKMESVEYCETDIENPSFSVENPTVEEPTGDSKDDGGKFTLTSNLIDEVVRSLSNEKVSCEWGERNRYCYVDCDIDVGEVYCWDSNDWLLYGFTYAVNGDSVSIDYDSKKRKKYVIADFDEGEQASPFAPVFELMEQKLHDFVDIEKRFSTATGQIESMEAELQELRKFKTDAETAAATAVAMEKCDRLFEQFEDLTGIEAFESLRENCLEYDLDVLEEKCFAIRGRNGAAAKFTLEDKPPKLKVVKTDMTNEPYGGVFVKYAIGGSDETN